MIKYFLSFIAGCCLANAAISQSPLPVAPPKNIQPISRSRILQVDSSVVTKHTVTIKGQLIPYTATAGCIPVWDEEGRPVAGVFYTYYERDGVADRATRPLVISFNGGPGTPSVWM